MARYKIEPAEGSRGSRKRVGRGPGSGKGKTAGKGTKGQKSRAGYTYRPWFEGGQMPLQRRVPKRGFKNPFRTPYQVVNLGDLEKVDSGEVDKQVLKDAGLIRHADKPVKVLGEGELTGKVNVTADAFSGSARRAIEEAGGSVTILEGPKKFKRTDGPPEPAAAEVEEAAAATEEAAPAEGEKAEGAGTEEAAEVPEDEEAEAPAEGAAEATEEDKDSE
ncbi:MAG: 50S ribosomal protein L15 [bacterium]